MSTAKRQSPRRFLVHDEIEEFPCVPTTKTGSPDSVYYRIRVWVGKNLTTLVLVSETTKDSPPSDMTCRVANYVLSAILKHREGGEMAYFEDAKNSTGQIHMIGFEKGGCNERRTLYDPTRRLWTWGDFTSLIKGHVCR